MFPNTSSSSTTLEGAPSPLFHIPWPFLDDIDEELFMSHLLSQHHMNNIAPVPTTAPAGERGEVVYVTNGVDSPTTTTTATRPNMVKEGDKKRKHGIAKKQQPKKKKIEKSPPGNKTGKKDRHSKICTAQGIRDRRMRLSLKVARKFFDLQDMLGFDKASKTIEWLLIHCKAAIQQLTPLNAPCNKQMSFSAASEESEVESEAKKTGEEEPCSGKRKRRKSRKVASNNLARESRDKARARARERTREKLMRIRGPYPKANPQISKQDSGNSSPQAQAQAQAQAGADLFEEPRAVMDELLRSSSSSTFSYNSPDFAAALSGSSHNLPEPRIEPAPGCYAITSKKPSLGNLQVQNIPNAIFTTAQIYDDQWQWNPSSVLLAQENPFPNSILMTNGHLQGVLASPLLTPTTSNATFQSSGKANHFL